jgi:hypothetical protein
VTGYVRYIQDVPERVSFREPLPWPATVGDVVTLSVVDAPAASVTEVDPDDANTAEEICETPARASVAVCVDPDTFVILKTDVNVRADGTVPNESESESTLPLAIAAEVPACTADPGATEK